MNPNKIKTICIENWSTEWHCSLHGQCNISWYFIFTEIISMCSITGYKQILRFLCMHETDDLYLILNAWQVWVLICLCLLPHFSSKRWASFWNAIKLKTVRFVHMLSSFYSIPKLPGKQDDSTRKKLQRYLKKKKKSGLAAYSGKCQRVCGINPIWKLLR